MAYETIPQSWLTEDTLRENLYRKRNFPGGFVGPFNIYPMFDSNIPTPSLVLRKVKAGYKFRNSKRNSYAFALKLFTKC